MTHTPEKWYVGYDQEYDIDAGDDGRTIGYPTGRYIYDGVIFTVTGGDQLEKIAENVRGEKTAHRIVALWNMAERLGLTTEEIATKESLFRAAPDMLEALEWLSNEFDCRDDEYGMVGFTHDEFRKVDAAIRKARGEE